MAKTTTRSHNSIVKSYFGGLWLRHWHWCWLGDVVTMWQHWQLLTNRDSQIKSREWWKCHFLSVQWVKFLRFFLWKHLLEMFKYYYIYYNLFVTGAWGSWRWGAESKDYVFSDVKSFCFCSSNFESDLKHLFWKCLTFWSGFAAKGGTRKIKMEI